MNITDTDIENWANKFESRGKLPILIRKLIQETISNEDIKEIFFRGDSGVDLSGTDGKTNSKIETDKIPLGITYWEFGTNKGFLEKANNDYIKRTTNFSEEERLQSNYIVVSPRRWANKTNWEQNKNKELKWKLVKAYDCTDIATWLERAPITSYWLKEEFGFPIHGILLPEIWWNNWKKITDKELNYEILIDRHNNEKETLIKLLTNKVSTINLFAETIEEGIAFIVSTLLSKTEYSYLLNSTIIINSDNVNLYSSNNHIVVINFSNNNFSFSSIDRNKITIIQIEPLGLEREIDHKIVLSHIPQAIFIKELQRIGFTYEQANQYARESGLSISILKRLLSDDIKIKCPAWANNKEEIKKIIPFAFCGTYNNDNNQIYNDLSVLSLLTDSYSKNELKLIENDLLKLDDSPILKKNNITTIISTKDIFYVLSPHITHEQYDNFFKVAELVFSERNPSIDLPNEQRWAANILGKPNPYSLEFIRGFTSSFCYLSVNNSYCKNLADQVITNCMTQMTKEKWLSLEQFFPIFAEASPITFLNCLENEIIKDNSEVKVLFEHTQFLSSCLRSNLLWALEKLAWYPDYFKRVVIILLNLCKFKITDNYSNSPNNTLYSFFRIFLPSTMTSLKDKIIILKELSKQNSVIIFNLCLKIIGNQCNNIITHNSIPSWLSFELTRDNHKITKEEYFYYINNCTDILLSLNSNNTDELHELLKISYLMSESYLQEIISFLKKWEQTATEEEKNFFSTTICQLIERNDINSNLILLFNEILDIIKPKTLTAIYYDLFNNEYDWKIKKQLIDIEYKKLQETIKNERKNAVIEFNNNLSKDEILNFVLSLKTPYQFLFTFFNENLSTSKYLDWFNYIYQSGNTDQLNDILRTILSQVNHFEKEDLFLELTKNFNTKSEVDKKRLATLLPGSKLGWQVAYNLGDTIAKFYWENNTFDYSNQYTKDEILFAVTNFLNVNNPKAAFLYALHNYKAISINMWITILFKMKETNNTIPYTYLWRLEPIFSYLDTEQKKYKDKIIQLELLYYKIIFSYSKIFHERIPLIYKELSNNPEFFVELHSNLYLQNKLFKDVIYEVLTNWDILPGSLFSQEEQEEKFLEWNKIVRNKLFDTNQYIGYQIRLSKLLAKTAYKNKEDKFLDEYLINFIEEPFNKTLQENFPCFYINERGIIYKNLYDGGSQERELIEFYKNIYERYKIHHPIFANIINKIISDLNNWAIHEDERATLEERLYL